METKARVKRSAEVDGLRIFYESAGSGDPPIVFVHGIGGDRTYFASQVEHLMPRHRAVTLDLRSHGESSFIPDVNVEGFERDVIAVLEDMAGPPVALCGHSVLGGVALLAAAARPDLVRGVVMVDGVIFFADAVREAAVNGLLPALRGEQWRGALAGYIGRLVDPAPPLVAARVMADAGNARQEVAASFFESVFGADFPSRESRYAEALQTIRCPLMYVHAKAPADLQKLQTLKPDAVIEQVVDSGHYVMLSAADQLNAMLDRFLSELLGPTIKPAAT